MSSAGASDLALIVGGDCNSRILNPNDIKTYPLFGDGAGAFLLDARPARPGHPQLQHGGRRRRRRSAHPPRLRQPAAADAGAARSKGSTTCTWTAGPSSAGPSPSCATRSRTCSPHCQLTPGDVDLYFPHQANIRIINAAFDMLKIPRQQGVQQPRPLRQHVGRLDSAGVDEAIAEGRLKPATWPC